MNFDSIKQLEFVSINEGPAQDSSNGDAYITIANDRIDITKSISIVLGYPEFVFVGTNGNAIGIKPVKKSEGAVKVVRNNNNSRVCGVNYIRRLTSRIASMNDVDLRSHYIRVPFDRKEDGYLIFDAGQMTVIEKQSRR
jgi:hypothetical protein